MAWKKSRKKKQASISPREKAGLLLLELVVSTLGMALATYLPLNHDVGVFLQYADRLYAGGRLYIDVIDPNVPAMMWLAMLPVMLAQAFDFVPAYMFFLVSYILLQGVICLTWFAMRPTSLCRKAPGRFALLFVITFIAYFPIYGAGNFGQRDGLFAMLILPYTFLLLGQMEGVRYALWLRVLGGVAAAVGLSLKPHFISYFLLCEAFAFLKMKNLRFSLRVEPVLIAAALGVYYLFLLLHTPQYFTEIMPDMVLIYKAFLFEPGKTFRFALFFWLLISGLAIMLWRFRKLHLSERLFIVAAWAMVLEFLLQLSAWDYRMQPVLMIGVLLGAVVLVAQKKPAAVYAMIAMLALAMVWKNDYRYSTMQGARNKVQYAAAKMDAYAAGKEAYALTTSLYDSSPASAYTHVRMAGSLHSALLMFLVVYDHPVTAYNAPENMEPLERKYYQKIIKEMQINRPALVLVSRKPLRFPVGGKDFNAIQYLMQSEEFQQIWKDYMYKETVSDVDYYIRRP
jgi:hypothetical protein